MCVGHIMELLSLEQLTKSASALDNIPQVAESGFRTEALIFVLELAVKVRVSQPIVSTAQLLVHRVLPIQFTHSNSFRSVDRLRVAAACLFLSCKINEQIRSLATLTQAYFDIERAKRLCKNPQADLPTITDLMRSRLRDDIITLESQVLRLIDFNFGQLEVPYPRLKTLIRALQLEPNTANTLHTVAWNFANDSFRCQACLVFPMDEVAAGCVSLAAAYMGLRVQVEVRAECVEMLTRVYEPALDRL